MVDPPSDARNYELGWHDDIEYAYLADRGLDERHIGELSGRKGESDDVLKRRLTAFRAFQRIPLPTWGGRPELGTLISVISAIPYVLPAFGPGPGTRFRSRSRLRSSVSPSHRPKSRSLAGDRADCS